MTSVTGRITPGEKDILIGVDLQNDFCPEGALAVPRGDEVISLINRLGRIFPHVILTQDWHPPGHKSFASSHPGHKPFETIQVSYGEQTLWPDHCVQGTKGAEFHWDLDLPKAELIIRKGIHVGIDSYSTFYENDHKTTTGLTGYLRNRNFERVYLAGLATDYCVHFSALDAGRDGFKVTVIEDACRAIDLEGSLGTAMRNMKEAGVAFVRSEQFSA